MRTRSLTLALALLAACSGGKPAKSAAARDSLTERQRDSILAQSRIPGASGVGSAMRAADSASARVRRIPRPPLHDVESGNDGGGEGVRG